ncbi:MAG: FecR domain-containing protein [Syntrophothermus sp.]
MQSFDQWFRGRYAGKYGRRVLIAVVVLGVALALAAGGATMSTLFASSVSPASSAGPAQPFLPLQLAGLPQSVQPASPVQYAQAVQAVQYAQAALSVLAAPIEGPATLLFVNGEVAVGEAASGGGVAWKPAASGIPVLPGMRIRTSDGYADLLLPGRSLIRIAPHTELVLTRAEIIAAGQTSDQTSAQASDQASSQTSAQASAQASGQTQPQTPGGRAVTRLFLSIGRIWVHVIRQINYLVDFEVQTPSAVAGVRGTIFSVMVASDGSTVVSVQKGQVAVSAGGDSRMINRREEIRSKAGAPLRHLPKFSGEETRAWKEQEDWLSTQEELDKQAEKEQRLQEKGKAGDSDAAKKEPDESKSEHKEREDPGDGADDGHGWKRSGIDGKGGHPAFEGDAREVSLISGRYRHMQGVRIAW